MTSWKIQCWQLHVLTWRHTLATASARRIYLLDLASIFGAIYGNQTFHKMDTPSGAPIYSATDAWSIAQYLMDRALHQEDPSYPQFSYHFAPPPLFTTAVGVAASQAQAASQARVASNQAQAAGNQARATPATGQPDQSDIADASQPSGSGNEEGQGTDDFGDMPGYDALVIDENPPQDQQEQEMPEAADEPSKPDNTSPLVRDSQQTTVQGNGEQPDIAPMVSAVTTAPETTPSRKGAGSSKVRRRGDELFV